MGWGGREGGELYPGPEILKYNPPPWFVPWVVAPTGGTHFQKSGLGYLLLMGAIFVNTFAKIDFWGFGGHAPGWKSVCLCVLGVWGGVNGLSVGEIGLV